MKRNILPVKLRAITDPLLLDRLKFGHYLLLKNDIPISEIYLNQEKDSWKIKGGGEWLFQTKAEAILQAYEKAISHPLTPWTEEAKAYIQRNYPTTSTTGT